MRQVCTFVALGLVLAAAAASREGAAHPPLITDANTEEKADELRGHGNALSREGRLPEAIEAYIASFRLSETFGVAANVGTLELKLQRYRNAAEHLALALLLAPVDANPPVVETVKKELAEAKQHVGALKIRVGLDFADVTIDGRGIDWLDAAHDVFVDPGVHTIAATRSGYTVDRRTVEVPAGARFEVDLVLAPLTSAVGSAGAPSSSLVPTRAEAGASARMPVVVAGAGVATVGTVLGVVFTVLANGKSSQAATLGTELGAHAGVAACALTSAATSTDCGSLRSLLGRQTTFGNAAIGSFVAGGAVALGTGAYALWPTLSGVRLLPTAAERFGGMVFEGAF
jgi:hypothetical protein